MPFFFTVIIILIEFVKFLLENVLIDNLESRTFSFVFFSSPPSLVIDQLFEQLYFHGTIFLKKKSMNLSFGPASSTTLSPMKHGVRSINIVYVNETLCQYLSVLNGSSDLLDLRVLISNSKPSSSADSLGSAICGRAEATQNGRRRWRRPVWRVRCLFWRRRNSTENDRQIRVTSAINNNNNNKKHTTA